MACISTLLQESLALQPAKLVRDRKYKQSFPDVFKFGPTFSNIEKSAKSHAIYHLFFKTITDNCRAHLEASGVARGIELFVSPKKPLVNYQSYLDQREMY